MYPSTVVTLSKTHPMSGRWERESERMHLLFMCTALKLQISLLSTFHWPGRKGACRWQAFPGQSPTHVSFVLLCNLLKRIMSKSISNLGFRISIPAFENLRSFISPALSDSHVINRTRLFWSDSLSVTALLKTPAVCLAWWSLWTSKEYTLSRAWRVGLVMDLTVPTYSRWGSRNFLVVHHSKWNITQPIHTNIWVSNGGFWRQLGELTSPPMSWLGLLCVLPSLGRIF